MPLKNRFVNLARLVRKLNQEAAGLSFVYRFLTVVGSILFALTFDYFLCNSIQFPFLTRNIICYFTVHNVSYHAFRYYLISLLVIPGISLLGFFSWLIIGRLISQTSNIRLRESLIVSSLPYTLLWLSPAFLRRDSYALGALISTFILAQLAIFILARLKGSLVTDSNIKTNLLFHGGVFVLGTCPGFFLLSHQRFDFLDGWGILVPFATAVLVWIFWLVYSSLISRWLHLPRELSLKWDALSYLPLSILPLQSMCWLLHKVDGKIIEVYSIRHSGVLIVSLAALGVIGLKVGSLSFISRKAFPSPDVLHRLFNRSFFWIAIPLMLAAIYFNPNIHQFRYLDELWVFDFTGDGLYLTTAGEMLQGKMPFRDIFMQAGYIRDGMLPFLGFKLFGVQAASYRFMKRIADPIFIIGIYFLGLVLFKRKMWAFVLVGIYMAIYPFFSFPRTIPAFYSLIFLVAYINERGLWRLFFSTAFVVLSFIWSIDLGATLLVGVGIFLLIFELSPERKGWKKLFPVLRYALFCVLAFSLFIVYLFYHKALFPYVQNSTGVFRYPFWSGTAVSSPDVAIDAFSQPRRLLQLLQNPNVVLGYLQPLLFIGTTIYLVLRAVKGPFGRRQWHILLFLIVSAMYFKRGLEKGSCEEYIFIIGGVFSRILFFILMVQAIEAIPRCKDFFKAFVISVSLAAVAGIFWYYYPPLGHLYKVFEGFSTKNEVQVPDGWREPNLPRTKNLYFASGYASSLEELYRFFQERPDENRYIFDFTNSPGMYFLLDASNPTRYPGLLLTAAPERQREVIKDLERTSCPYIIYRGAYEGGDWENKYNGIDFIIGCYILGDYILGNYHPIALVERFTILSRGMVIEVGEEWRSRLFEKVDYGYIPLLWGKEREAEFNNPDLSVADLNLSRWKPKMDIAEWSFDDGVLRFRTRGEGSLIESGPLDLDPVEATYLLIRLKVDRGQQASIFWGTNSFPNYGSDSSVTFNIEADGRFHDYLVRMGNIPGWRWGGRIKGIALSPTDRPSSVAVGQVKTFDYRSEIGTPPRP